MECTIRTFWLGGWNYQIEGTQPTHSHPVWALGSWQCSSTRQVCQTRLFFLLVKYVVHN